MKNNRKKGIVTALLCGVLLLGGCGSQGTPEEELTAEDILQEESAKEGAAQNGGEDEKQDKNMVENAPQDGSTDQVQPVKGTENGSIVIEIGPDKAVWGEGSMTCTLHDFQVFDSPKDASVSEDEMYTLDAERYADQSIFLLMQADFQDQGYVSHEADGTVNVSMFTIEPETPVEGVDWSCSYPVYLSDAGTGPTNYYHAAVNEGETRTVTIGFYVPVKDAEELRTQCRIVISGCHDEGYVYEIPE